MGLDNGVKLCKEGLTDEQWDRICRKLKVDKVLDCDNEGCEVSYWRKCYNIRRDVLGLLEATDDEIYEYPLDSIKLKGIIDICKNQLKERWDSESFWCWEEIKPTHKRNIKNMKRLQRVLRWLEEKDIEYRCYFYDSY